MPTPHSDFRNALHMRLASVTGPFQCGQNVDRNAGSCDVQELQRV